MHLIETVDFGDGTLTFDTGKLARQADGSVLVTMGETVVIVSAVSSDRPRDVGFLPLSVDFIEKGYAAGKIPGSYFRREGRPAAHEVLNARLIDRPIRPLFPKTWRFETQVIAVVLSVDRIHDPSICAMNGASAALHISNIPFDGPIAGVRVAQVGGHFVANPTYEQLAASPLDLLVAVGTKGVVMVEGEADFVPESMLVDALMFATERAQPFLRAQESLRAQVGKEKREHQDPKLDEELYAEIKTFSADRLDKAIRIQVKQDRYQTLRELGDEIVERFGGDEGERGGDASSCYSDLKKKAVRAMVVNEKIRIDGRGFEDVRAISSEVGVLPRTHGSALFTRGETQALVTVTLGTGSDEQRIDTLRGDIFKSFLLHYNFWPFSVGEVRRLMGTARREIGHGMLAERGLKRAIDSEDFPYTIRIVSEILESNGSSSMATVCGGSLALMAAGVPMRFPVAGIAMGLIAEGDEIAILTDILGDEDHLGDMDFKVIGNRDGISGLQMDIKIDGIDRDTLVKAMDQARNARLFILDKMDETLGESHDDIAEHAPRIFTLLINPDKIRDLIGPGGKHIRGIQAETGTKIDVDDEGTVKVAASDGDAAQAAIRLIRSYTAEPEIGEVYLGRVVKVLDFGAFVRIAPNTDGLVPISELANRRVAKVEDVLREGDEVLVKVIGLDRGKIRLSRKAALADRTEPTEAEAQ